MIQSIYTEEERFYMKKLNNWELVWKNGKTDRSIKRSGLIIEATDEYNASEVIMETKIDVLYDLSKVGCKGHPYNDNEMQNLLDWLNKVFRSKAWQDNSDYISDDRLMMVKV